MRHTPIRLSAYRPLPTACAGTYRISGSVCAVKKILYRDGRDAHFSHPRVRLKAITDQRGIAHGSSSYTTAETETRVCASRDLRSPDDDEASKARLSYLHSRPAGRDMQCCNQTNASRCAAAPLISSGRLALSALVPPPRSSTILHGPRWLAEALFCCWHMRMDML